MTRSSLATFVIAFMAMSSGVRAQNVTMIWADEVIPSPTPPANPADALGAPDGATAGFFLPGSEATYLFGTCVEYDEQAFADLLGVDVATLRMADVFSIERNGTLAQPFENATWTFVSGLDSEVQDIPLDALATGTVATTDYLAFFGLAGPGAGDWPFVLIDLQVVDRLAEDFAVTITRGPALADTPDPDVIGLPLSPLEPRSARSACLPRSPDSPGSAPVL